MLTEDDVPGAKLPDPLVKHQPTFKKVASLSWHTSTCVYDTRESHCKVVNS